MRLLRVDEHGELCLTPNLTDDIPPYAILSHTWGEEHEEVSFKDLTIGPRQTKTGFKKLRFCAGQAELDSIEHFWVDTCCIDQSNSSELSEAINSMFRWYQGASKCYVYLSDLATMKDGQLKPLELWEPEFRSSRWFTRGWTLQELIAPPMVEFYCSSRVRLGDKRSLGSLISEITGISLRALQGTALSEFSVEERFEWAKTRHTKRAEDKAYSLLGIFDIYMPPIYGEGATSALKRLEREIINDTSRFSQHAPVLDNRSILMERPFSVTQPPGQHMASLGPGVQVVREVYYRVDLRDGQPHNTLTHTASLGTDVGPVRPTLIPDIAPPKEPQGTLDSSSNDNKEPVGAAEPPSAQPIGDDTSYMIPSAAPVLGTVGDVDTGSLDSLVRLEETEKVAGTAKSGVHLPQELAVEVVPPIISPKLPTPPSHPAPDAQHDSDDKLRLVASIDIAQKYIQRLTQLCTSFKGAEVEIQERIIRIEVSSKQISAQMDFVSKIASTLSPEHLQINVEIVLILEGKLRLSLSRLEKFNESMNQRSLLGRGISKWKYGALKENLDRSISDLESWQRIYDPSWYLLLKTSQPEVDSELAKQPELKAISAQSLRSSLVPSSTNRISSVFLPETGFDPKLTTDIPFSTAKIGHRHGDSDDMSRAFILEQLSCPPYQDGIHFQRSIRNIAIKLANVKPGQFGILSCKGVIRHLPPRGDIPRDYTMVFRMPTGTAHPHSLRSLLIEGEKYHSLSARFDLASQLAKSVSFVHVYNFVHGNIRPESVLLFRDNDSSFGNSFLMGFERMRMDDDKETLQGDSEWQQNLYRHPQRQGMYITDYYIMQHDIYSLGVCLLEIGLWQSFVVVDESGEASPSEMVTKPSSRDERGELPESYALKDHLVSLALTELPRYMGTKYSEIVKTCLTCLDENNADFGDEAEFLDEDGIMIGVRFIEKVMMKLNTLAV